MKILKYELCTRINLGTEEEPQWNEMRAPVEMDWNEENERVAAAEAAGGEYVIVERPDPEVAPPTRLDTMEAQLTYTAMMTDTLLEV